MTKIAELTQDSENSSTGLPDDHIIKNFCKSMLKKSLFIGTFQEKRFVAPLNSYRDIIKISEKESDFIQNLLAVKRRCSSYYPQSTWIGITLPESPGAPVGYNLWVTLNQEVFGTYWYKVRNVLFHHNEIMLKLEVVRPVIQDNSSIFNTSENSSNERQFSNISEISEKVQQSFKEFLYYLFTDVITLANTREAVIFISLLMVSIGTFLVHVGKYLMEYMLKLIRETSGLIKVCTPIFQSVIGLLVNAINGLYRLIAVMWLSSNQPKQQFLVPGGNPMLEYNTNEYRQFNSNKRALTYPTGSNNGNYQSTNYGFHQDYYPSQHRSSVRITPLD